MIAGVSPGESTSPSRPGCGMSCVAGEGPPRSASSRRHPGLLNDRGPGEFASLGTYGEATALPFGLGGWGKQSPMGHYGGTGGKPEARVLVVRVLRSCARLDSRERHKKPPAEAGGLRVVCLPGCHVMRVRTGGSRAVVPHGRRGGFQARSPRAPARGFWERTRAKGTRNHRRKPGDTAVRDRRSTGHAFPHHELRPDEQPDTAISKRHQPPRKKCP